MDKKLLYQWCAVPADALVGNPSLKVPFRMVEDSVAMGELMAMELIADIEAANRDGRDFRAIIPCGPKCWYEPFVRMVNQLRVSLKRFTVFHMDECLDWQGNLLSMGDPYNFRAFMLRYFYQDIDPELAVPEERRFFLNPQ
jgi:glucosamine-6-phosphate deaminase